MEIQSLQSLMIQHGVLISIFLGLIAVLVAVYLGMQVKSANAGNAAMQEVAGAIEEGAKAYLNRQIFTISLIAVIIFALIFFFKDGYTALGFLVGAVCSLLAGYIGMRVAVLANVRTAQGASESRHRALQIAFNGGAVTGLLVVGLALVAVGTFYLVVSDFIGSEKAVSALVGLALGSSLISVFARLGGGIYTKAADVGADLVGKIEQNLEEDDPRNPATIADNVGDNVGDCAGMAADVFETYVVSLIGAMLLGMILSSGNFTLIVYPFYLCAISILSSLIGILFINKSTLSPGKALMGGVILSAVLSAAGFWPLTQILFGSEWLAYYVPSLVGLFMTAAVVVITNYYTATEFAPVRKIAKASETGHATNIIAGLAVGQHAAALPVFFIVIAIIVSFHCCGLYGIATAVMSMLSLSGIIISLDAFGPITDNAGGVAVMSKLPKEVRRVTDELDAVGNTMKAVTKGYAIASAGLAALVLFGSYVEELKAYHIIPGADQAVEFSLQNPKVIIGLFIGGLLPFIFTAYTLDAVGIAAGAVVREVRRQIAERPGILTNTAKPDYGSCVDIVTKAALKEMIFPALLPIIFVLAVAAIPQLGPIVLGGVLVGTIVTGLFMGIIMTSSGGAWDNAKKYIEEGNYGGKGSPAHAAAVTGDTVGDPYKDTAGPAINPMIKVVNILAILVIPIFFKKYF